MVLYFTKISTCNCTSSEVHQVMLHTPTTRFDAVEMLQHTSLFVLVGC